MNLFTRVEEILDGTYGDDHFEYIKNLIPKLMLFVDSDFFETIDERDAAIDELIEFLKSKKSKPKDNGHA